MMNLIFNNVPHQSGEKKSINLTIDYCMVTWNVIFEFLMERTDFHEKKSYGRKTLGWVGQESRLEALF